MGRVVLPGDIHAQPARAPEARGLFCGHRTNDDAEGCMKTLALVPVAPEAASPAEQHLDLRRLEYFWACMQIRSFGWVPGARGSGLVQGIHTRATRQLQTLALLLRSWRRAQGTLPQDFAIQGVRTRGDPPGMTRARDGAMDVY
ncbi:Hypothetical predicted protein [Marmota monax]|uniref:Uncharacterized protein n=1 Tax=Marmota monax TaxID=9995 RepID=A0A5E4CV23_MARMO|nr:Hypothetical predicted protein [Marmota monax]